MKIIEKMTKSLKILQRLFPAIFVFLTTVSGQEISVEMNSYVGQIDHIFDSYFGVDQSYLSGSFSLAYQPSLNTRLYGSINRTEVLTNQDYSTGSIEAGFQYRYLELKNQQLFAGLIFSNAAYAPAYDYYEFSEISAYGDWKYFYHPRGSLALGYNFQGRTYSEMPQGSNAEHNLYVSTNYSLNTGTSFKLRGWYAIQDFQAPPTVYTQGRHGVITPTYEELNTNYLTGLNLRVSQSINKYMGLVITGSRQYRINRAPSDFIILDQSTSPFIDRFRWDGNSGSGRINLRLPGGFNISGGALIERRNYLDVPIYEFDFDAGDYVQIDDEYIISDYNRTDIYTYYDIRLYRDWKLPFFTKSPLIGTSLTIGSKQNESNDPLYDYAGNTISFGIHLTK